MQDIDYQKRALRREVKARKKGIPEADKRARSKALFTQLAHKTVFKQASVVMAYWSMADEVYTHDFVESWYVQKTILLPVVAGDELLLRIFEGREAMQAGARYGIPEPAGSVWNKLERIDLIIVPGVAFDTNNNRMGRGKAYYDKLLRHTNAYKAGVCFNEQLFSKVPHDAWDIRMDAVFTA